MTGILNGNMLSMLEKFISSVNNINSSNIVRFKDLSLVKICREMADFGNISFGACRNVFADKTFLRFSDEFLN